jgi:hypothetical protein
MAADTDNAVEVQDAMIAVFDAFTRGELAPQVSRVRCPMEILMLAEAPRDWAMMWPPDVAKAIAGYHRASRWDGVGRYPQYLSDDFQWCYDFLFSVVSEALNKAYAEVANEVRKHQLLSEQASEALRVQMPTIKAIALMSRSPQDFRSRMAGYYCGAGMQLEFAS